MASTVYSGVTDAEVIEACRAKGLPCTLLAEQLLRSPATLTEWDDPPATATSAARGAASSTRRRRVCLVCSRTPDEHPTLVSLSPELHAKAGGSGGKPTALAAPADPYSLDSLDHLVRRPRIFAPGETCQETSELSQHPWEHLRGLAAVECARAHACSEAAAAAGTQRGASGAASDAGGDATARRPSAAAADVARLPALWTSPSAPRDVARPEAHALAVRLLARADGLRILYFALRSANSTEFLPKERATDLKIFHPLMQELVGGLGRAVREAPPADGDQLVRLSRAVARQDERTARGLYDDIFYTTFKAKLTAEVELLKAIRDAKKAGDATGRPKRQRDGDDATAAAAAPSAKR